LCFKNPPGAAPPPHDSAYLFTEFAELMDGFQGKAA
jgi:carbamoylphosphate synthase small subunit